jgi:hypothetical protein
MESELVKYMSRNGQEIVKIKKAPGKSGGFVDLKHYIMLTILNAGI